MKRLLFCERCKCRKRHMVSFMSQQAKFKDEHVTGDSVLYNKQCLACNHTAIVDVPLLEWLNLKRKER